MKAADISDHDMLAAVLAENVERDGWALVWGICERFSLAPEKVVGAKLRQLLKRGMLDGCPCGCRGDWQLTRRGADVLGVDRYYNNWTDSGWTLVERPITVLERGGTREE